jgi:hypothetical protein
MNALYTRTLDGEPIELGRVSGATFIANAQLVEDVRQTLNGVVLRANDVETRISRADYLRLLALPPACESRC